MFIRPLTSEKILPHFSCCKRKETDLQIWSLSCKYIPAATQKCSRKTLLYPSKMSPCAPISNSLYFHLWTENSWTSPSTSDQQPSYFNRGTENVFYLSKHYYLLYFQHLSAWKRWPKEIRLQTAGSKKARKHRNSKTKTVLKTSIWWLIAFFHYQKWIKII